MTTVAVIMPAFNAGRYIAAAVESILAQTHADLKLFTVNDGSTDATADILSTFKDPRLHTIHQENRGISPSLNRALHAACDHRIEFIARMDADDIAAPDRIARQLRHMQKHEPCILLGTEVDILCPAGLPVYRKSVPADHDDIARALWSGDSQAIIHPSIMMRAQAVKKIGGYRPQYSGVEDLDLYLRLLPCGCTANLPEPLLGYRQHPHSSNARLYDLQVRLLNLLISELDDQCPFTGLNRHLLRGWDRSPPVESFRRWGWNALRHNRPDLARAYAARALRLQPLHKETWRLAACALRGH